MSLRTRIALLFNVKTAATLDAVEDPREVLDYAYGQQRAQLRTVKRGRVEVATARRLLERQAEGLREQAARGEDQARRALRADRQDLARAALERKQTSLRELQAVERQLAELAQEEERLARADQQLGLRVERFRLHRTVLVARSSAAEAQLMAHQVLEGVEPDLDIELSLAVERAEEKIERLAARASAVESLAESGAVLAWPEGDPIEQQLEALSASEAVEAELAALERELRADAEGGQAPAEGEQP